MPVLGLTVGKWISTCVEARVAVCCANEPEGNRFERRKSSRNETAGCEARASRAFLSELLYGIEGEPVQIDLSRVRILFELLGFLLNVKDCVRVGWRLTSWPLSVYNGRGFNFLFMIRRP